MMSFYFRVRALQTGAGRELDDGGEVADVLLRNEASRHPRELEARKRDQADVEDQDDGGRPDDAPRHVAVLRRHPFEGGVEAAEGASQDPADAYRLAVGPLPLPHD